MPESLNDALIECVKACGGSKTVATATEGGRMTGAAAGDEPQTPRGKSMSFELYERDLLGDSAQPRPSGPLAERFTFQPFSVLDCRSGDWQERKRAWAAIGLRGEEGRKGGLTYTDMADRLAKYQEQRGGPPLKALSGTSIFDPVACEMAYRWFCRPGGQVLDPFAGGSVRGIIAAALGMHYWGCDLRPEQIAANERQADEIATPLRPTWVCGDSMERVAEAPEADMVFSCPPYGDLEVYSEDPADLSRMEWHTFVAAYKRIILRSLARLKEDRFACFVVGDFRDKRGFYRNFVSLTIEAFEECGARLYNEAVLVTSLGTAAMRATTQFNASRKLVKTHQNVLVFCKGDPKKATAFCMGGGMAAA